MNGAADLIEDVDGAIQAQCALFLHEIAQRPAREEVFDDISRPLRQITEIEDPNRVRMPDPDCYQRLPAEALDRDLVIDQFRTQYPHRHIIIGSHPSRAVESPGSVLR